MKERAITLSQLAEQLKRWEGQEILHAGNLAEAIMNGAAASAQAERERAGKRGPGRPRRTSIAKTTPQESGDA